MRGYGGAKASRASFSGVAKSGQSSTSPALRLALGGMAYGFVADAGAHRLVIEYFIDEAQHARHGAERRVQPFRPPAAVA